MRIIQRTSAFLGWLALTTVGVLMVLEATGIVDDQWRASLSRALSSIADPAIDQWEAALAGAGLAAIAAVILFAQFTPYRRTTKYHTVVDEVDDGQTLLHSGAVQSAINAVFRSVDGIADASVVVGKRRADARISALDGTNVVEAAAAADRILDAEFWPRLGIEPLRVDLRIGFQRSSERVIH